MRTVLLALALAVPPGYADEKAAIIHSPSTIRWVDGPPSLPPGAKVAILEGDPAKPGHFVMRAKLPDGYKIPPHAHPQAERVTVLSGSLRIGMGDKFDPKHSTELSVGAFAALPPGMKHFAWAEGETVIQVYGEGPWIITYVNPDDDPRKKK